MEKRDHIIMISLFLVASIAFMSSFDDNFTGNIVADQKLSDCRIVEEWNVCDVSYPDGTFVKEGFRELKKA
jgi:hypothetical protein